MADEDLNENLKPTSNKQETGDSSIGSPLMITNVGDDIPDDVPNLDGADFTVSESEEEKPQQTEQSLESLEEEVDQANPGWIFYLMFSNPVLLKDSRKRKIGFAMIILVNMLIIVSTVAICAETVEPEDEDWLMTAETFYRTIEIFTVTVFTIDFLVKALGTLFLNQFGSFAKDYMNWLDLMSILPFYVELMLGNRSVDLRFLRVFRMFRFTRIFRMSRLLRASNASRFGNIGDLIVGIFSEAGPALTVPFLFMTLSIIFFSVIMYEIERFRGPNLDDPDCVWKDMNNDCKELDKNIESKYYSIVHSFWWSIVTFSTVGYGDKYPDRTSGKMVNVIAMCFGIFYLAMPLAIIGGAFVKQFGRTGARRARAAIVEAIKDGKQVQFDMDALDDYTDEISAHVEQICRVLDEMRPITGDESLCDHYLSRISRFEMIFEQYCIIFGTVPTLHTKEDDINRAMIGQDGGYYQQ